MYASLFLSPSTTMLLMEEAIIGGFIGGHAPPPKLDPPTTSKKTFSSRDSTPGPAVRAYSATSDPQSARRGLTAYGGTVPLIPALSFNASTEQK